MDGIEGPAAALASRARIVSANLAAAARRAAGGRLPEPIGPGEAAARATVGGRLAEGLARRRRPRGGLPVARIVGGGSEADAARCRVRTAQTGAAAGDAGGGFAAAGVRS